MANYVTPRWGLLFSRIVTPRLSHLRCAYTGGFASTRPFGAVIRQAAAAAIRCGAPHVATRRVANGGIKNKNQLSPSGASRWFSQLCLFTTAWTFLVVVLGAFTRLTDAGLGCPDWPGCYGTMIVQEASAIDPAKAWTEMIHRYVAGTLGLFILAIAICTYIPKLQLQKFRELSTALVLLVIFQAALGMWTVTLLLHPTIVMAHLLGGMTILSLMWLLYLRTCGSTNVGQKNRGLTFALIIALILVILQIALGGWTSSNYAAMACTDFPKCREMWWPTLHWREAFSLLPPLNQNYEGGFLAHPARVTIHFLHRMGALIVLLYVGLLSVYLILKEPAFKRAAIATLILLLIQVGLGISNILFALPLFVATAHNGVAALLLLSIVSLNVRGKTP